MKLPKTAFCDNQRVWDLLRLQRHDLFHSGAITEEELALLVQDHAAVERLESYDGIAAKLRLARAELEELRKANGRLEALLDLHSVRDGRIGKTVEALRSLRAAMDQEYSQGAESLFSTWSKHLGCAIAALEIPTGRAYEVKR